MNRSNLSVSLIVIVCILLNSTLSYGIGETDYSIGKGILKLILYILIFLLLMVVVVYGTRFIAKNSKKFIGGKYVTILDRIVIDTNTKLILLELDKYIYFLGINNNHIELIDKILKEDFNSLTFQSHLKLKKYEYMDNGDSNMFIGNIGKLMDKLNNFFNKEDRNDEE